MQAQKVTIHISADTSLSDAVCKALNPSKKACGTKDMYQTVKPSLSQERIDAKEGASAFAHSEWRSQIGVMLG